MELQGHWNPGVMQPLTPNSKDRRASSAGSRSRTCPGGKAQPARCSAAVTASPAREGAAAAVRDFLSTSSARACRSARRDELRPARARRARRASVNDPNLEDGARSPRSSSPFVQLYLDIAYSAAIGQALDDAIADQFAGQADATAGHRSRSWTPRRRSRCRASTAATTGRAAARPVVGTLRRKWLEIAALRRRRRSRSTSSSCSSRSSWPSTTASTTGTGSAPLTDFVGLDNYREAFDDPVFRQALAHNAIIVGLSLVLQLPLALGLALLLNRPLRGRSAPSADLLRAVRPLRGDHRGRLPADAAARRPRRRRCCAASASAGSSSCGSPTPSSSSTRCSS